MRITVTPAEQDAALEAFSYTPDGRQDAIANLERLVMIRRAVAAGFYTDTPPTQEAAPEQAAA